MQIKYNILVVEDNPEHQKRIAHSFSDSEISLDIASDGKEAEHFIFAIQYNLIVLDLILPDTSGMELLKLIKSSLPSMPVIMISAFGNERDTVESIKLGADNYISKTIGFEQRLHDEVINTLHRNQLKSKITEAEERYKLIFEEASDCIFTLDLDGRFVSINQKCRDLFGAFADTVLGRQFSDILQEPSRSKAQNAFHKILFEGVKPELYDVELLDKNHNRITLEVNSSLLRKKNMVTGILCIARDITHIKEMQNQQKKLQSHLMNRHRLATVGKMLQGVAHNLNTPLATIMGNAELVSLRFPNIDELDVIQNQCEVMNDIIRTMVNKDVKEKSNIREYWDVNKIIQEELKFFESNVKYKQEIKWTLNLSLKISKAYVVYNHFSQALDVVIQNAIDAMHDSEHKEIEIHTYSKNAKTFLDITDTGCGISNEDKEHIFEPFFTTKKTHSATGEPTGVGLGLFHAYSLLSPYGIEFKVINEPRQTTIRLEIPVKE